MKRRLFKTLVAVLAIAAAAAGPVRGQTTYNVTFGGFNNPDMNTTVSVASLPETFAGVGVYDFYPFEVISDYCGEFTGASVTSGGDGKVSVNIPSSNQMTITVSGTFEGTATIHIEGYDTEVGDASRDITVSCVAVGGGSGSEPPTPGQNSNVSWVLTPYGDLQDGDTVVIVDKTSERAMTNNNGDDNAPSADLIELSGDQNALTAAPAATLKWVVVLNNGNYQFRKPGTDDQFLYCINSANGVRVGTGSNNQFTFENGGTEIGGPSDVAFLKNMGTSYDRYLGVYSNQDWRCYISISSNIENTVIGFYVRTGAAPAVPHTVRFASGNDGWTVTDVDSARSATAPAVLQNVMAGDSLVVTAPATLPGKVKSVKAVKYVVPPTPLDNTTTAWSAGTFVVPAGGLTYSDAITVSGDVTLVLTDGTTLTLNKGISLASGATLTIQGNGTMNVNGTNESTASTVAGSGTITLTSGTLTARGGNGGSFGYGAYESHGGNGGNAINGSVIVSGGTLTARGGNGGSVGDMGYDCSGGNGGVAISGTLTINGGSTSVNNGSNGSIGEDCDYCYAGTGGEAVAGTVTDNR